MVIRSWFRIQTIQCFIHARRQGDDDNDTDGYNCSSLVEYMHKTERHATVQVSGIRLGAFGHVTIEAHPHVILVHGILAQADE